jgi:hypothetical protein
MPLEQRIRTAGLRGATSGALLGLAAGTTLWVLARSQGTDGLGLVWTIVPLGFPVSVGVIYAFKLGPLSDWGQFAALLAGLVLNWACWGALVGLVVGAARARHSDQASAA